MGANFTPTYQDYKNIKPFRFWCQKVLPAIYDDSLSYYELLTKVVKILNDVIDNLEGVESNTDALLQAFNELQDYVNNYFESENFTEQIDEALDRMAEDGDLSTLIQPLFDTYTNQINALVDEQNTSIETQNDYINEQNEKINVLESRVDEITSLPSGSTSGDAELADIRIAYNGESYANAGDSVRGQANSIIDMLSDISGFQEKAFTKNGMITTNEEVGDTVDLTPTANEYTDYAIIPCSAGDIFYITGTGWNNQRLWAFVDASDKLISKSAGNAVADNAEIYAPVNAVKLVVNAKRANARRILLHTSSLLKSINGTSINLTVDTIGAICDSDLNNLPNNRIYGCSVSDGSLAHVPTNEFLGQIITYGKSEVRTNSDTQIFIGADGNVYKRLYWTNAWTNWEVIGMKFLTSGRANSLAGDLDNTLAKVTGNCIFTADYNYWNDLPTSQTGYIFINQRYADNWNIQTAISIGYPNVYHRITAFSGSGDIYRDWACDNDIPNVKILAVGDSICYGARNSGKGFVGDLGLPYKNIAVSGATLSNVFVGATNIPDQLENENSYQPDIIIADGGINDYYYNASLGSVPTAPVTTDSEALELNRSTVIGSLEYLFYLMVKKYPNAQRFFLIVHKVNRSDQYYSGYAPTKLNSAGYNEQNLHDAIVATCNVYNVKVIDVYKDSMLNTKFLQYVSPVSYSVDNTVTDTEYVDSDGLHPLALGYKEAYVPLVREAIKIGTKK